MSGVGERRKPRTNDRPPLPSPLIPGGTRGDCKLQEEPVGVRLQGECPYPPVPVKRTRHAVLTTNEQMREPLGKTVIASPYWSRHRQQYYQN